MTLGKVKLLGQQEVRHLSLRVAIEVRGQQAAEFLLQCNHLGRGTMKIQAPSLTMQ